MNTLRLPLLLACALLAAASAPGFAQDRPAEPTPPKAQSAPAKTEPAEPKAESVLPKPQLDAKLAYCKTCHGLSGQGFRGAYTMPRLAGQQPQYLEDQLRAFIERRRLHPLMQNVAHALSPITLSAIAAHFKDLNPKPLGGVPKDLVAVGKKIYDEGVADKQIPACASCHGADAKGDGAMPRLAGQLNDYTTQTLANWSKERGQDPAKPDASATMAPIAQGLTHEQAAAVAAYVGSLE